MAQIAVPSSLNRMNWKYPLLPEGIGIDLDLAALFIGKSATYHYSDTQGSWIMGRHSLLALSDIAPQVPTIPRWSSTVVTAEQPA